MPVPLVLLPGMNCSRRLWDGVVSALRPGPVDRPVREVLVLPLDRAHVDDQAEALLDRLPQRFAVGGLSLGAIVAMALHRRAPDRVAGLLVTATNARPPTDEQRAAWTTQLAALAAGATPRDLQEELLPLLLGEHPGAQLRDETLRMADEVGSATLTAQLELQLTRVDERPALAEAVVPCTVVAAADDRICPLERHTEIHRLVDGSDLTVIPGAPHLVTLSHPHRVAQVAADWLERVDG